MLSKSIEKVSLLMSAAKAQMLGRRSCGRGWWGAEGAPQEWWVGIQELFTRDPKFPTFSLQLSLLHLLVVEWALGTRRSGLNTFCTEVGLGV